MFILKLWRKDWKPYYASITNGELWWEADKAMATKFETLTQINRLIESEGLDGLPYEVEENS